MATDNRGYPTPNISRRSILYGVGGLVALGSVGALSGCGATTGPAQTSAGPPQQGGALRVVFPGTSAAADVLDPHVVGHSAGGALSKAVWERLVEYNDDLTLRYRLAESLEPNDDGSVWRIVLRRNVVFSDGSPLTARDVVWSLERMLEEDKPSAADLGAIDITGTHIVDEHVVSVRMREPIADFGSMLAGWYVYVLKHGTTEFSADRLPVGTGPFVLAAWYPGDRAVLRRNELYWDGVANLDELVMFQVAESDARFNAFRSQEADVIYELSPAQGSVLDADPDVQILTPSSGIMSAFQMRVDAEPFTDRRVREAMRLSVDREAIVESVFYGYAEVGNDLYGMGAPFYNGDLPQRGYDPARARRLLREAGHDGLSVTLHTADVSPGQLESATLFAEQAKESGINVALAVEPGDTYFSEVSGNRPFTQTGWWNYSLDYFYGQTLTSDAPDNGTGWHRPEWDETFAQARAEMDETRRGELLHDLQVTLWQEGGHIVHSFAQQPAGARGNVHGVPNGVPGTGDWASFSSAWMAR